MNVLQAILLGALQGVTEFLPVSSSGHLVVTRQVMGLVEIPILFDVLLHIATLVVVVFVFRDIVWRLLKSLWNFIRRKTTDADKVNLKLIVIVIVATFFTGILGYFISEIEMESRPKLVSLLFIVTGLLLVSTRFFNPKKGYSELGIKHGVITGIAQGFGVFPGISRAGITITASLFSGLDREKAGEYSFLISIPAILGALVLTLKDLGTLGESVPVISLAAGMISSALVGFVSLLLLLRLLKSGKLYFFSFYLIPLGIAGLLFL